MSRLNLNVLWGVSVVLLSSASLAWGQQIDAQTANENSLGNAAVNIGSPMIDLSMPSVNDPAAVEMLFKEGNTIASILEGLKEKGFHIQYRKKHFLPEMTLLSLPESTRIDDLLREILEPWNFRVYRSPLGQLVVVPNKKKISRTPSDETHETLKSIIRTPGRGE